MTPEPSKLPEDFIDTVSHGVRSPLMVITSNAQLIQKVVAGGPHAELVQRSTADITRSVQRLLGLLDDLVDFYRLQVQEKASASPRPTLIGELLAGLVEEARRAMGEHELVLEVAPALPEVVADPVLLRRAVQHLLANAASYPKTDAPIVVRATAAGRAVRVEVIDRGPGIAPEERGAIFEPFRRLPGARGGVGLDLYLVRRFVEAMSGQVEVQSAPGAGSTFTITLPAA